MFLWAWVFTMLGVRKRLRRRGSEGAQTLVRGSTLGVFSILGSAGYVVLSFLTMGSLLLPSLVVGFIWAVYLALRLIVDVFRIVFRKDSRRGASVVINCVFLLGVLVVVVCFQVKANSLEHQIGALRYGTHTEMFSKIMPAIVARGEEAVVPLIEATNEAMANDDQYYRSNIVVHASFCLSQIGGPDAEKFLADILKQHREPDDFGYRHGYKAVHFAYARCAGPRAVQDLIHVYERMPKDAEQNDRWIPLVALLTTASKEGVAYVLDHFDDLLDQMEHAWDGNEQRVLQAATECVVFGDDPRALKKIPVYREVSLMGFTSVAEPRPNDYNSEFFWIPSSKAQLREEEEIRSAWENDSAAIRNRWMDLLE